MKSKSCSVIEFTFYILSLSPFVFSYTPLSLTLLNIYHNTYWLRRPSFLQALSSCIFHTCFCPYQFNFFFASFLITLCLSFWPFLCYCYCYFWLPGFLDIFFWPLSISAIAYVSLEIERIFKLPGNCTKYSWTKSCVAEGTMCCGRDNLFEKP